MSAHDTERITTGDASASMATTEMMVPIPGNEGDGVRHSTSYASDKAKILSRLRRIEGQVRGIERMVENDQYCVDVLTQMSSVISALRATGLLVLEDHIRGCVVNADQDDQEAVLDELNGAIERFVRSVS